MSKAQELQKIREQSNTPINRNFKTTDKDANLNEYFGNFLTQQEVRHAVDEYDKSFDKVRNEFKEHTKLHGTDYSFLFTAVVLQCVRQYLLTPFSNKENAEVGSKIMSEKYRNDEKITGQYYYAPEKTIIGQKKVPFDTIAGSKKFQLGGIGKGLSGNSHRFRTLGHDPILGYIFGTANIMTNTMTMFNGSSFHIKYMPNAGGIEIPTIYANADTGKIFSKVWSRVISGKEPQILVEAIAKEYLHLKSDNTTAGLPLPFLSSFSPDLTQTLAELGMDAMRITEIGKQSAISMLINAIISVVHGLLCAERGKLNHNLYKVRTRKILLYSNLIASTSNIIFSAISKSWKNADVGGMLVTLYRLYSDPQFIDKLKYEFINNKLSGAYKKKFNEYSFYYEDL